MSEVQDRLEIDDLLSRYARAIDTQRWDLLDTVFAPDAQLDYRAACGIAGPYPEVKRWLAEVLPSMFEAYQHHVTNREIRIDGDRAKARSLFLNPNQFRLAGEVVIFTCGGSYHDRLERRVDGWRIVRRIEDTSWWSNPVPGLPDVPPGVPDDVDLDDLDA